MDSKYNKLLKKIALKYNLKLLILFGSRAKKKENKSSDWDFGFLPNKEFTVKKEMDLFNEIISILNDEKVDLINIESSKNLLVIKNIFLEGICLYEYKKGFFSSKKWSAWIAYKDFERYSTMQFELTKKRLEAMI